MRISCITYACMYVCMYMFMYVYKCMYVYEGNQSYFNGTVLVQKLYEVVISNQTVFIAVLRKVVHHTYILRSREPIAVAQLLHLVWFDDQTICDRLLHRVAVFQAHVVGVYQPQGNGKGR